MCRKWQNRICQSHQSIMKSQVFPVEICLKIGYDGTADCDVREMESNMAGTETTQEKVKNTRMENKKTQSETEISQTKIEKSQAETETIQTEKKAVPMESEASRMEAEKSQTETETTRTEEKSAPMESKASRIESEESQAEADTTQPEKKATRTGTHINQTEEKESPADAEAEQSGEEAPQDKEKDAQEGTENIQTEPEVTGTEAGEAQAENEEASPKAGKTSAGAEEIQKKKEAARKRAETAQRRTQEKELLEKREQRKRRRKRNQMLAYLTTLVFVVVVIGAVACGIIYAGQKAKERAASNASVAEDIDNVIGQEETIVMPEPTETEPVQTPEQQLDEIINAAINVMPIEDKVAGLFIVTPESITGVSKAVKAGEGTQTALNQWAVGGIVYAAQNIKSQEQFAEMISNTVLYSRYPIFIAVEEEGGSNSCVSAAGLAENAAGASAVGQSGDPAAAYAAGSSIAAYLTPLGFNLDLAPVADLKTAQDSPLGDRAYGADSASVAGMVSSMVQGLEENGISACLKHFPGIGSTDEDTHAGLAGTERTAEQFRAEEFAVFQAGIDAGADFVMVSHIAAPALAGDNTPCSMSEAVVTGILREELGFKGVIISDEMNSKAISEYYAADEAAIKALKAGCDMILMPEDFEKAYQGVLDAVQNGTISEERVNDSLRRIYRIKYAGRYVEDAEQP